MLRGHGAPDEVGPAGAIAIVELHDGAIAGATLTADGFGVATVDDAAPPPESPAVEARALLRGARGARRAAVVMGAALILRAHGAVDLAAGAARAAAALEDGAAWRVLERLITLTHASVLA